MKTAILGPRGSYSHEAALHLRKEDSRFFPLISDVFEAVSTGQCDEGIVPLENQLNGSVGETMDNLYCHNIFIQEEVLLPIAHCLAAQGHEFSKIASHPQAIEQCRKAVKKMRKEILPVTSTSEGFSLAMKDRDVAAIGSPVGARLYGLQILEQDIADKKNNSTLFILISKARSDGKKTSLAIIPTEDKPGVLADLLMIFKVMQLNLSRIESRPTKEKMGEYIFYLDIDAPWSQVSKVTGLLKGYKVKHLGSYDVRA